MTTTKSAKRITLTVTARDFGTRTATFPNSKTAEMYADMWRKAGHTVSGI